MEQTNKTKKAQMKIQQMAFMLIAVILFFGLVAMFVVSFKLSGLREAAAMLEEKNALLLVTKLANSPEFSCGRGFGTEKVNCVDLDKAMMLKQDIAKYVNFWGVENIEIRRIYPELTGEIVCSLENYPDCNIIRLLSESSEGTGIANFVALCRKHSFERQAYNKCELGKIIVAYRK